MPNMRDELRAASAMAIGVAGLIRGHRSHLKLQLIPWQQTAQSNTKWRNTSKARGALAETDSL
jgi:hypothetical protein